MVRRFLVLVVCFALVACGNDAPSAPSNDIEGSWSGTSMAGSTPFDVDLTLIETDHQITGSGAILPGTAQPIALSATGTFTSPAFTITLVAQGFPPLEYSGSIDGNSLKGNLNGSGFTGEVLNMTRIVASTSAR